MLSKPNKRVSFICLRKCIKDEKEKKKIVKLRVGRNFSCARALVRPCIKTVSKGGIPLSLIESLLTNSTVIQYLEIAPPSNVRLPTKKN